MSETKDFDTSKILKGGLAAVLAAYAAKKDPYMFQGFAEKMDEFEKADRDARSKYIEKSSEGIARVLAENAARRKEKITDYSTQIDQLTEYTGDKYLSASMIKAGLYPKMIAEATAGKDITTLFKVTKEFEGDKGNLTTEQLAGLLAGKPKATFPSDEKFSSPKKTSPISRFISGDEQEDVTADIRKQTQALVPDAFKDGDTDEIDAKINLGGSLTERGKQFFSEKVTADVSERSTNNTIVTSIINALGGTRKTYEVNGNLVFQYDDVIEEKKIIADSVKDKIFAEIIELQKKEKGMTRATATQIILNKYNFGMGTTTHPDLIKYLPKKDTDGDSKNKEDTTKEDDNTKSPPSLVSDLKKLLDAEMKDDKYYKTGQGGRKFDRQKFLVYRSNQIAKLVKTLTGNPNSKYYNKPEAAKQYILKELILGIQ